MNAHTDTDLHGQLDLVLVKRVKLKQELFFVSSLNSERG